MASDPYNSKPHNVHYVNFGYHDDVWSFRLKITEAEYDAKGITDLCLSRYILVYGNVTLESSKNLCITKLGWGEFAMLPEKYNGIIHTLN